MGSISSNTDGQRTGQSSKNVVPKKLAMSFPPLSFAQNRFWFLDQFESNRAIYNSCKAERLRGHLDVTSLERSLQVIVQRHEILRTTYPAVDGCPFQQVAPRAAIPLVLVDLHSRESGERHSEFLRLAIQEAQRPFKLAEEYPIRA